MSEVKFDMGECENEDMDTTDQLDVCISVGPVLMFIQLLLQIVLAVYFTIIYYKRGDPRVVKVI